MQEIQPTPIVEQTNVIPPTQSHSPIPLILISFLAGITLAAAGFFGYQYFQLKKQLNSVTPSPAPSVQPTTSPAKITNNLKTYINSKYKFQFSYPSDWKYVEIPNETYQTGIEQILLQPESHPLPPPNTGARAPIVISIEKSDPSPQWRAQYFDNYQSQPYPITDSKATKITGINKEAQINENIIIIEARGYYLTAMVNDQQKYSKTLDQILSSIRFTNKTSDQNTDINTYTNSKPKYQLNYPSDWKIDSSRAGDVNATITLSKGSYKISIVWPEGFGPGTCVFDDQPRNIDPDMTTYCEGKFIEFKSTNGSITYRRLVNPTEYNEQKRYTIYTKDPKGFFVTVPPINYDVPSNPNPDVLKAMDAIIASIEYKN